MDYIEENNLFYYAHQYGFRRKKCTQDAVLYLHDHIRQHMSIKETSLEQCT